MPWPWDETQRQRPTTIFSEMPPPLYFSLLSIYYLHATAVGKSTEAAAKNADLQSI